VPLIQFLLIVSTLLTSVTVILLLLSIILLTCLVNHMHLSVFHLISDIAIFVLKRDIKLQPTDLYALPDSCYRDLMNLSLG